MTTRLNLAAPTGSRKAGAVLALLACCGLLTLAILPTRAHPGAAQEPGLWSQTQEEADSKSAGCISCHGSTDSPTMHATGTVRLGCIDCHGGDAGVSVAAGAAPGSRDYERAQQQAHVQPRNRELTPGPANPVRAYTAWLRESPEYVRFVNPGDLRIADETCGQCHMPEVRKVRLSMMTHGAMLWGAALYNNGAFPFKNPHFGESYSRDGQAQRLQTWPPPTPEETRTKGVLPYLEPLPRFNITQPGNVLRVFERGGRLRPEVGNPTREEEPGRLDVKVSDRGFGTLLRTDPVFLGLQKTRLLDPLLYFPGTNDQPGDYRGSGCTACHVIYANDTSPVHAGPYAQYGNLGKSATADPTIPKDQPGHPIRHVFTRAIPSSQCMVCHMHPGTNMVASYYGYTWWDNEVDARLMYPEKERKPSQRDIHEVRVRNPEGSAIRGKWSDVEFLKKVGTAEFNQQLEHSQFASFHSHGWIFRAVYKRDRKGALLDAEDNQVSFDDPERFRKAVHLKDIHLEKGMHCTDCHFEQDSHGDGKLYGETRNAIEIGCADCHGTLRSYATLLTSGPAAPQGGNNLLRLRTPWKQPRFYWNQGRLYQRSVVEPELEWQVTQVKDTVTPGAAGYNEKSRLAKTLLKDGSIWGNAVHEPAKLAHSDERMTCYSCHSSWTTSCIGCHLSMTANERMPMLHNEGTMSRNWTSYNFQILRDDIYMLGVDGTVTGNKIAPVRSACAVVVSSENQNRAWLYYGQQTVSSEGFSGQAFSTYVPHTVRGRETKTCTDCHVSAENNNNAWMAQILVQGTGFVNYMGRFVYVAAGMKGLEAIAFAERDEPPAVIGSDLHRIVYPDRYRRHEKNKRQLREAYEHPGKEVLDIQVRGEYAYTAMGAGGFRIYDIANIDNKDFSERIVTAPVSRLGQRLHVPTRYATAVASPSTLAIDPTRARFPENEEGPIHLMYGFLYVADKYEGLVVVGDPDLKGGNPGVGTLLDGEARNNFLVRALAFNPDGILNGARRITIAGVYAYILADAGLVVVSLDDPLNPKVVAHIGAPQLQEPRGLAVQFRYAFVADAEGLKVLDVTHLDHPRLVEGALVPLPDARNVTTARTYAYVSAGRQGMAIIDIERPHRPFLEQMFDDGGQMDDTNDIQIGMVNSSQFAFVADGRHGVKVVQLFSPDDTKGFFGFSPHPAPKVISTFHTHGPALKISRGIDRDRAVDESGNQLAVFGRRGSRPFKLEEMQRLYLRDGQLYTVTDAPPAPPTQPPPMRARRLWMR